MAGKQIASAARFDIYLVALDPTIGHEIRKTRPCVVISPNEINTLLQTVIVAPLTSKPKYYGCRINLSFNGIKGEIALDQMRAVDKTRLQKHIGRVNERTARELLQLLAEMFAE